MEMLLVNPKRRSGRKAPRTAAQRRATARMIAANRSRGGKSRRRNPVATVAAAPARRRAARRRNPVATAARRVSRRRNPISLGAGSGYSAMLKTAIVQGAGAVAMDVAFGQVNRFLPASMQRVPGTVGVGDAVKAVLTVMLGRVLNKATRGMSSKAAAGSLVVQAHAIISTFVPSTLPLGGMGYAVPGRVVQGNSRVGPNRVMNSSGMGAYLPPGGSTPLLNAYTPPGQTVLLNGSRSASAQRREGVTAYR